MLVKQELNSRNEETNAFNGIASLPKCLLSPLFLAHKNKVTKLVLTMEKGEKMFILSFYILTDLTKSGQKNFFILRNSRLFKFLGFSFHNFGHVKST